MKGYSWLVLPVTLQVYLQVYYIIWVDSHWRYSYINIRLPNGEYIRI